jgi:hypothetical protein
VTLEGRSYLVVIRARGASWNQERAMEEQELWPEHAACMNDLAESGFIVLGGTLDDGRALHIVDAESEEEVRRRFEPDPWTGSGLLAIKSVHRWTIRLDGRVE